MPDAIDSGKFSAAFDRRKAIVWVVFRAAFWKPFLTGLISGGLTFTSSLLIEGSDFNLINALGICV